MSLSLFSFTTMKQTWHGEARRRQSATLISFYLQRSMQAFNCYNELYVHLCPLTIMCAAGPVGHFPPPVCTGGLVSLCTDIHPHSADRPDRFLTQFEKTAFAKRAPPNSASPPTFSFASRNRLLSVNGNPPMPRHGRSDFTKSPFALP